MHAPRAIKNIFGDGDEMTTFESLAIMDPILIITCDLIFLTEKRCAK
jgi:hypothetical protein